VSPPRSRNSRIPKAINDAILKAMAPDVAARYQRAGDLLADLLLAADHLTTRRTSDRSARPEGAMAQEAPPDPQPRSRERETPQPRFCWHCHKPLHARSDQCPFCGEAQ
jgi:hypothetical protein